MTQIDIDIKVIPHYPKEVLSERISVADLEQYEQKLIQCYATCFSCTAAIILYAIKSGKKAKIWRVDDSWNINDNEMDAMIKGIDVPEVGSGYVASTIHIGYTNLLKVAIINDGRYLPLEWQAVQRNAMATDDFLKAVWDNDESDMKITTVHI